MQKRQALEPKRVFNPTNNKCIVKVLQKHNPYHTVLVI